MKKIIPYLMALGLPVALLLSSCEKWELPARLTQRSCEKPKGDITAQATERKVAFTITNSSGTIDSVFWDFGDGKTLKTKALNAEHTYTSTGKFNVTALLYNTCGTNTPLAREVEAYDIGTPSVRAVADPPAYRSARLTLTLAGNGNATIRSYGLVYSSTATLPDLTSGQKLERTDNLAVNASSVFDLQNLTPGTTYYVRAYAINASGKTGYSDVLTVQTLGLPVFAIDQAVATTAIATVNLTVTAAGGNPAATDFGIVYSATNSMPMLGLADTQNTPTISGANLGGGKAFTLGSLSTNTRYYYRGYARLPSGEVEYTEVKSFTTQNNDVINGLIARVLFTNRDLSDQSGNGNAAVPVGGPVFMTDRFNQANSAIQLDGIDDYIYMADKPSLNNRSEFSISLWIRPSSVTRTMQIFNKSRFSDGQREMYSSLIRPGTGGNLTINTDVKMNSNCQSGVGWQTFTVSVGIPVDTWHHLVLAYRGNEARTYLDGVLVNLKSDLPLTQIDDCPGGDLKFGVQSALFPNYFIGGMDDIRIYNRQLTAAEVATLKNL